MHNIAMAILFRLSSVNVMGEGPPAVISLKMPRVRDPRYKADRYDVLQFLDGVPSDKRRAYVRYCYPNKSAEDCWLAYLAREPGFIPDVVACHVVAFAKFECNPLCPLEVHGKAAPIPRCIAPPKEPYRIATGTYVMPIEKEVYKWVDDWGIGSRRVVMKGMNTGEIANDLAGKWDQFWNPVAILGDVGKLDASVHSHLSRWVEKKLALFFDKCDQPEFLRLMALARSAWYTARGRDGSITYDPIGMPRRFFGKLGSLPREYIEQVLVAGGYYRDTGMVDVYKLLMDCEEESSIGKAARRVAFTAFDTWRNPVELLQLNHTYVQCRGRQQARRVRDKLRREGIPALEVVEVEGVMPDQARRAYVMGAPGVYGVVFPRSALSSGQFFTSIMGITIVCAMVLLVVERINLRCELSDLGDDFVLFLERADLARCLKCLDEVFTEHGLVLKRNVVTKFEHVEFCQMRPFLSDEGWLMTRNPYVAPSKDLVVKKSVSPAYARSWLRQVGECGKHLMGGCPVFNTHYKMMMESGRGARYRRSLDIGMARFRYGESGMMGRVFREPSERERIHFYDTWDMEPYEQRLREARMRPLVARKGEGIRESCCC